MINRILAAAALFLSLGAAPALSQTVDFNLFEIEGFSRARVFEFGPAYTEEFGIEVPVPFRVAVPIHDDIELISDGRPDGGGFVKFTLVTAGEPRTFLENIQVVTATIPLAEDADNPAEARVQLSALLLRDHVFEPATRGFDQAEILAVEQIDLGGVTAVQLVGRYIDPSIGPMLLRLVALPHPDQAESYVTVANINLTLVPVTDGETLANSLTGQIVSSWAYQ